MTEFQKYIQRYLDQIPSENWMEEMINSGAETIQIFSGLDKEKSLFAYAEGKWTLKELLLHLIDTEKIFQYRALRFARKDETELSGFDEDLFAANSFANDRTLVSLLEEIYHFLRKFTKCISCKHWKSKRKRNFCRNHRKINRGTQFPPFKNS